jgi:hypothetical protein
MRTELRGVDEFFNSAGVQLAPLGFGHQSDWEVIDRQVIASAVATVDFLFDDGLYDEIELVGYDITPATDNVDAWIRISDDDGATYEATAYTYATDRWGDGTVRSQSSAGGSATHFQVAGSVGNAAGETLSIKVHLLNPDSANTKHMVGTCAAHAGNILTWESFGTHSTTSPLNGIRFLFDNTGAVNTTAGTFILRGRRKIQSQFNSQDDWVVIDNQTGISAVADHDVFWDDGVYSEIEVTLDGVIIGTDNQDLEVLMSFDGSTFLSGTGDYEWARNYAHSAAVGAGGSTSDTRIVIAEGMGTGTNEFIDGKLLFSNIDSARQKTVRGEFSGNLQDNLFRTGQFSGLVLDAGGTSTLRGFRISGEGATTFSADRIQVRGRRITPVGVLKQDWEVLSVWDHAVEGDSANIDFTDIPSTEFDEFELTFRDMNTGTTANSMELRFSNDNGATFDSSTNYRQTMDVLSVEAASSDLRSSAIDAIQFTGSFGSSSVRLAHGVIRFSSLDSGSRKWIWFTGVNTNDSGNGRVLEGGGVWVGTGSDGVITAFRLILGAGGNYTGGKAVLRGRRKQ